MYPETYQFNRRRRLPDTPSANSSKNNDIHANTDDDPNKTVIGSPESFKFKRLDVAGEPIKKTKKSVTYAVPWSPPETFAFRRGFRPDFTPRTTPNTTKSFHPETYKFRRRTRATLDDSYTTDVVLDLEGRLNSPIRMDLTAAAENNKRDEPSVTKKPIDWYPPLPVESYRFTRLQTERGRDRDQDTGDPAADNAKRHTMAEERQERWKVEENERYLVPPETYRMHTGYVRAEPPGTYLDKRLPAKPKTAPATSSNRRRPKQTCGCLFFAYHGYCQGNHQNDSRQYYNMDPQSRTGETIAWQQYRYPADVSSTSTPPFSTSTSTSTSSSHNGHAAHSRVQSQSHPRAMDRILLIETRVLGYPQQQQQPTTRTRRGGATVRTESIPPSQRPSNALLDIEYDDDVMYDDDDW